MVQNSPSTLIYLKVLMHQIVQPTNPKNHVALYEVRYLSLMSEKNAALIHLLTWKIITLVFPYNITNLNVVT